MSREIEFRVWSNDLKKYRRLDDINQSQGLGMGFEVTNGIGGKVTTIYQSVNDAAEQYTGLKDKNHKKVYEGDIDLVSEGMYGVIIWKKGGFWIKWPGRYKPFEEFLTPEMDGQLDIVGDIHNNPELLEAVK